MHNFFVKETIATIGAALLSVLVLYHFGAWWSQDNLTKSPGNGCKHNDLGHCCPQAEVGIYKRKQELDQESNQENKKERKKTRSRPRKRSRKKEKTFVIS